MKAAMYAIIKKDFRGVANNRRLFSALLIVPLVLTVIFPSIFVITIYFVPDDPAVTKLMSLLPEAVQMESMELTLSSMILNYILPVFFLSARKEAFVADAKKELHPLFDQER